MTQDRAVNARRIRTDAAHLAEHRHHDGHKANGDEQRYSAAHYAMSFTKGLDQYYDTGLVEDPMAFEAFRMAIDSGSIDAFTTKVPVPRKEKRRKWEAPTAGTSFDLIGLDAQAVTMPPAPVLCSNELAFEMAEVYESAMLRDVPLTSFDQSGGNQSAKINDVVSRLNNYAFAQDGFNGRPRKTDGNGNLSRQTVFRGSAPRVEGGPYLSQFLMMGNQDQAKLTNAKDE